MFPVDSRAIDLSATEITNIEGRVEVKKTADSLFKKLHSNLKLGQAALTELKAQQGALLFKVVSGSNFQVQTADVIAGVKGTLFELDIIDNFNCILETPGLQIGTLAPGGTSINVYKGEVELTHKQTGKKRSLKAGEGLAALSGSLMKLNNILQEGFTPLRKFDPATVISENFGDGALELLNADDTLSGISAVSQLGNINAKLAENRYVQLLSGSPEDVLNKASDGLYDELKEVYSIGKDLAGEKFKIDFSRYSAEQGEVEVNDQDFHEIYLGNKTFAAARSSDSKQAKIQSTPEGLLLNDGNAMFKVIRYDNSSKNLEFFASFAKNGSKLITTVKIGKGELYGRIPGSTESFRIPAGEMAYVFDSANGSGNWSKPQKAIDAAVTGHALNAEREIAEEKGEHKEESSRKQVDAVKKILNSKPGNFFKRFR
jgi:hypothetical protein